MQQFALFHDNSSQGWQTAYLAFHVAARLGAILQVFLGSTKNERENLQVEIGGRAAGVVIETDTLTDFSVSALKAKTELIDGLFSPRHLVPDEASALPFLEELGCPLWVVSEESDIQEVAILVSDPARDTDLINYAKMLSQRLQKLPTALTESRQLDLTPADHQPSLAWRRVPVLSPAEISAALKELNVNLLFISSADAFRLAELPCNYIICPAEQNA